MKKVAIYIGAAVSLCLASCISLEDSFINPDQGGQTLKIMASVADFSNVKVGTKALEDEESKVNEITMIIFDSNNNIVGRPVNLSGANSVFMIDTQNAKIINGENHPIDMVAAPVTQTTLKSCSIYMVANCWHILQNETINNKTDLETVDIPVEAIGIPSLGIPMIGSQDAFDLSTDRADGNTLADVVMKKLYAKVNVRFQINSDQVIKIPSFTLKDWTVSNIPTAVCLGEPADGEQTANADKDMLKTTDASSVLSYGMSTIKHSESAVNPEYFQFTFYVPEHRVNPDLDVMNKLKEKLTTGGGNSENAVPESDWQRFKPKFCADTQKPMYVTVNGIYSDHQGQVREVTYSLYLGQNNSDNFHINRNQELNNIITIKGVTNSASAVTPDNPYNISVDHRVEVTSNKGYSIAVEREALLDSHFEVRPMDVYVSDGGKVVLTVNSTTAPDDGDDWLRMEESYKSSPTTHIVNVGVRNYFTSDLVTNTLAEDGVTITINENSRIWLYFDENTEVYDKTVPEDHPHSKKYRDISLTVDYYADKNSSVITESQELSFRQMNLWRVRNADNTRYYDIEYHEEYLYNYASNDNYGKRKDGMEWGMGSLLFSDTYEAFAYKSRYENSEGFFAMIANLIARIIDSSINNKPHYDFYVNDAEAGRGGTARPYSGKDFSIEIMEKVLFETDNKENYVSNGTLVEDPKSAVEYCYSKNKRDSDGNIIKAVNNGYNTNGVGWFLPSIDQIEEIVVGAYSDFEVFQNKFYWASQPSYKPVEYEATGELWIFVSIPISVTGELFFDDDSRARSTKVNMVNGVPQYVTSGTKNAEEHWNLDKTPIEKTQTGKKFQYDEGNKLRTEPHRIRCVRNTGLVSSLAQ